MVRYHVEAGSKNFLITIHIYIYIYIYIILYAGPPRGSVGPGSKYLFGGPDDVIMYSSGTRVY